METVESSGVYRNDNFCNSTRTQLINAMRGMVKAMGGRLPSCSTKSFHMKVDSGIPQSLRRALQPLLTEIGSLTESIQSYDRQIEELAKTKYPETIVLRQITGVGALTTLGLCADPGRSASFWEEPRRGSLSGAATKITRVRKQCAATWHYQSG